SGASGIGRRLLARTLGCRRLIGGWRIDRRRVGSRLTGCRGRLGRRRAAERSGNLANRLSFGAFGAGGLVGPRRLGWRGGLLLHQPAERSGGLRRTAGLLYIRRLIIDHKRQLSLHISFVALANRHGARQGMDRLSLARCRHRVQMTIADGGPQAGGTASLARYLSRDFAEDHHGRSE